MTFQELLAHMSKWRASGEAVVAVQEAKREYVELLEREFLKKGKALLEQLKGVKARMRDLQAEEEVLKSQLSELEHGMQQTIDLGTGDSEEISLSALPGVQAFWAEVRGEIPAKVSEAPVLESIDLSSLLGAVQVSKSSYDASLLDQESDDVLNYL